MDRLHVEATRFRADTIPERPPDSTAARQDVPCDLVRHGWSDPRGCVRLQISGGEVRRINLSDGTAFIVGRIHELMPVFSVRQRPRVPVDALAGVDADTATTLLGRANGAFLAIVAHKGRRGEPVPLRLTVLSDRLCTRALYYGQVGDRAVVSTSPQEVSDALGLGRAVNPHRLLHVCLARNLVDGQTLFRRVRRLHNDELIRISPGELRTERIDLSAFEMPDVPVDVDPADPHCIELGRRMLQRAVRLRVEDPRDHTVTLLLSSGTDSRVLLSLAHESGLRDVLGVSIGNREGFDEASVAEAWARSLGFSCASFHEEDLDLRGRLEEWVAHCAYPPKQYNHLLLSAALTTLRGRGGVLWVADTSISYGGSIYMQALRLRAGRRLPSPMFWKRLLPLQPWVRGRLRAALWLLSLDSREALAVSLAPGRDFEWTRRSLALFGRRAGPFESLPPQYEAVMRTLDRHDPHDPGAWYWFHQDVVFPTGMRSRGLLADGLGARLDYPLKDLVLAAFARGLNRRLPPGLRYSKRYKSDVYEHWLPVTERHPKKGLVGSLHRWFADPRKLGEYLDVVASRQCLERGIFDRAAVGYLLDRVGRLSHQEAQLLWTVLGTELLFRLDVLRPRSPARPGSVHVNRIPGLAGQDHASGA